MEWPCTVRDPLDFFKKTKRASLVSGIMGGSFDASGSFVLS